MTFCLYSTGSEGRKQSTDSTVQQQESVRQFPFSKAVTDPSSSAVTSAPVLTAQTSHSLKHAPELPPTFGIREATATFPFVE